MRKLWRVMTLKVITFWRILNWEYRKQYWERPVLTLYIQKPDGTIERHGDWMVGPPR